MRFQVSAIGFQSCQGCGLHAKLRTLDVRVAAIAARKREPSVPPGWAPLIALCGMCWTDVVRMLREKATPDSSTSDPYTPVDDYEVGR